jgi:hypothetical protein
MAPCDWYVTTAIVGAQLLLVAAALINVRLQLWGVEAEQVKASRTHQGPIQSSDDIVVGSAAYMLGQLPSLHALRGNGLRFVAMTDAATLGGKLTLGL